MEVDAFEVTVDFVLNLTGRKRIGQVKELSLRDQNIASLERTLLARIPVLESLDVSHNQLSTFPPDLIWRHLHHLDVSHNQLTSAMFAKNFANLETLNIAGNQISQSDKHILVETCPKLHLIDGHKVDSLRNLNDRLSDKLQVQLDAVWEDTFSDMFYNGVPIPVVTTTIDSLVEKVIGLHGNENNNLTAARDFLLRRLAEALVNNIQCGSYSPTKRQKMAPAPKLKHRPQPRMPQKSAPSSPRKSPSKNKTATLPSLPPVPDYDPVHFIRCHHGDRLAQKQGCGNNDPTDEFTKVWQCKLEPDPHNNKADTGLVATCGGQVVCLIDCSSGRVMKRYRHPEEQFFALAWTTLSLPVDSGTRSSNVLAVGGYNACIKLLHPEQFVCYKEWGSGKPEKAVAQGGYYISDMVFHPDNKTWLFAGTSDTTVTLWDIGIPSGPKHDATHRKMQVFCGTSEIHRLALSVSTNHLVAGCGEELVAWSLPHDANNRGSVRKSVSVALEVPCDHIEVDGMTLLSDDLVACKCLGEGTIFLWRLSDCLGGRRKAASVEISPLVTLQWTRTEHQFINLGAGSGLLGCGDVEGALWLYNLESWLNTRAQKPVDGVMAPSRILAWPECDISRDDNARQMTDLTDKPQPLILNDVAISRTREYIVTVTDNNMVCVWRVATATKR